jgi:hypothetical protein
MYRVLSECVFCDVIPRYNTTRQFVVSQNSIPFSSCWPLALPGGRPFLSSETKRDREDSAIDFLSGTNSLGEAGLGSEGVGEVAPRGHCIDYPTWIAIEITRVQDYL